MPNVLSHRGTLSLRKAKKSGCNCSGVFGDPALLVPKFYIPQVEKQYEIGIIPHYMDQYKVCQTNVNFHYINVFDTIENVIDEINKCKYILSSSLHGLIVAHAYGIKAKWLKVTDDIGGDGFKYKDYLESVQIKPYEPLDYDQIRLNDIKTVSNLIHGDKTETDTTYQWEICTIK